MIDQGIIYLFLEAHPSTHSTVTRIKDTCIHSLCLSFTPIHPSIHPSIMYTSASWICTRCVVCVCGAWVTQALTRPLAQLTRRWPTRSVCTSLPALNMTPNRDSQALALMNTHTSTEPVQCHAQRQVCDGRDAFIRWLVGRYLPTYLSRHSLSVPPPLTLSLDRWLCALFVR